MLTILELTKTLTNLNYSFFYHTAFVYKSKITVPVNYSSYFTEIFGADTSPTTSGTIYIKSVSYYSNSFSEVGSAATCASTEKSFYFDFDNQELYVNIGNDLYPDFSVISIFAIIGFSNKNIYSFNDIPYLPEIIDFPALTDNVDSIEKESIKFTTGDIVLNNAPISQINNNGFFDFLKLKGQTAYIMVGEDDTDYNSLTQIFSFFILNQRVSFSKCILSVRDLREKFNIKIPTEKFNTLEYPNIGDDLIDSVKPFFLGYGKNIPGICIDANSGLTYKTFRFSDTINPSPSLKVESYKYEKWQIVTPLQINNSGGTITLSLSDSHVDGDITRGILKIRATGRFERPETPGDQIKYLNNRYLDIPFNSSNYDTAEFTSEDSILANTGIYIDSYQDLFQYFKKLQNGSDIGFLYEINETGGITLRVDNPNRTAIKTIQNIEILNNTEIEKDFNFERYYSDAIITYSKDWDSGEYLKYENRDYRDQVLQENGGVENIFENNTLLKEEQDAINKSNIILDDTHTDRPVWNIVLSGIENFSIRNFDILYVDFKFAGQRIGQEYFDAIAYDEDVIDSIASDENVVEQLQIIENEVKATIINTRDSDGLVRCQVVGRKFNFNSGQIELSLREKPYSEVFFNIKGV